MNGLLRWTLIAAGMAWVTGCAITPDQFVEDGPATRMAWESASAADIRANHQPSALRVREWPEVRIRTVDMAVYHLPLYFEDPFVDKGHLRTEDTHPLNIYRWGWEDFFAGFYTYPRHWLNTLALPISVMVQPPWQMMESDGRVSRQALGYDHDATESSLRTEPAIADHIPMETEDTAQGAQPTTHAAPTRRGSAPAQPMHPVK